MGGDPARHLGGVSVAGVAGHAFAVDVDPQGRGGWITKHQISTLGSRSMCSPVGLATRNFFSFSCIFGLGFFFDLAPGEQDLVAFDVAEWGIRLPDRRTNTLYYYM